MRVVPLLGWLTLTAIASAAPATKPTLLDLAKKKFAPRTLTAAELRFFAATEKGEQASALVEDPDQNNPAGASNWPESRIIHAECLEWLCKDREAASLVSNQGVNIAGVRIDGDINLDNMAITFPFTARKCALTGNLSLRFGRMPLLLLDGCIVRGIDCQNSHIDNGAFLRGFVAQALVTFQNATIGGDIECDGTEFNGVNVGTDRIGLNADGAIIHGAFILRNSVIRNGEVRLLNTTIGSVLECNRVMISNPGGETLDADGAKVGGRIFLRGGFVSEGMVDLLHVKVGSNVELAESQLINPEGRAFRADSAKIEGNLLFRPSVVAQGQVRLVGARIDGNLECDGAQFSNPDKTALDANGSKIGGGVFLRDGFSARGEVNLSISTIGGTLDCENGRLSNPRGRALNANGTKVDSYARFINGFSVEGCLDLRAAKVGVLYDDEPGWPAPGKLLLDGFTYDRIDEDSPLTADSRLQWLQRQPDNKFLPQPYEQLASVMRSMGHEGEVRKVMIEKNLDQAKFTKIFSSEWWWHNFFGWLIGYGYRPLRALGFSIVFILFGWGLFHWGRTQDLMLPSKDSGYVKGVDGKVLIENGNVAVSENYPCFNAFLYSLESFIPLLNFDQKSSWSPKSNQHAMLVVAGKHVPVTGGFLRGYLAIHIIFGWILTALWFGAVTGLARS